MDSTENPDQKWKTKAACRGYDPNMWFEPSVNDEETQAKNELAKKICKTCIVRVACLKYALPHERYGIWGGFSAKERDAIRIKKNIQIIPRRPV